MLFGLLGRVLPGHDTRLFARSRRPGTHQNAGSPMREISGGSSGAALGPKPKSVSRMADSRIPRGTQSGAGHFLRSRCDHAM